MLLNTKQLGGVPVVTRAGDRVGKVSSFDVNDLTGRIAVMRVKASGLVARLSDDELLVPWDAILEMTDKKITIVDGMVGAAHTTIASAMAPNPSPTLMKEG